MAATVPPANDDRDKLDPPADQADSDLDAEGEEETDLYEMDQQLQNAVHQAYSGEVAEENSHPGMNGGRMSAAVNGGQHGGDNDETEPVGAVKLPDDDDDNDDDAASENDDAESGMADGDVDPVFEEDNDRAASESSESESEAEEDWEAESNGREEADLDTRSGAMCIFCTQDEEHDPSEDFEEWLTCAVCGDHSHRQCAREQEAFDDSEGAWRCPSCVQNKLEPDPAESPAQRKNGVGHLTKELLPAHAGNQEDGFHSIFDNNMSDELLNSSRSLRKRKASSIEAEEHIPVLRKRRRQTDLSDSHDLPFDSIADQGGDGAASPARPMRSRRTRAVEREHCRIVTKQLGKLVIGFRLEEGKVTKILSTQSRPLRNKKKAPKPSTAPQETQAHFAPIPPAPYVNHFHPFHDHSTRGNRILRGQLGGNLTTHYQSTVMERDLRITGSMRGQSSNHQAPPGFDVGKPWKVEKRIF